MKLHFIIIAGILPCLAFADDDCATMRRVPDGVQSLQEVINLGLCRNPQTAAAYAALRSSRFNKNAGYSKNLFIDSGAFSAAHNGKQVDIDLYIDYINSKTEESKYGRYSEGRYAWKLKVLEVLETPIPAKGKLGIWNY